MLQGHSSGATGSGCSGPTTPTRMSAYMKFSEGTGEAPQRQQLAHVGHGVRERPMKELLLRHPPRLTLRPEPPPAA
ncbi:hypothetical protein KAV47_06730 [Candidatus Bathyarchaeota archaeon]|nr:hypothetical protein [Candidatus Bathyarchaeota archaeon]